MRYVKCPYCEHSDGNDDIEISKEIIRQDNSECVILQVMECDICGKTYQVETTYGFKYERLVVDD